jgi:hypothetical protein
VTEVRECVCGREFEVVTEHAKPWTVCPQCLVPAATGVLQGQEKP